MKITDFIKKMGELDDEGMWAFKLYTLKKIFPEKESVLLKGLAKMNQAGLIVKIYRGFYVNPKAKSLPSDTLSALVSFFRPWDFTYLSLESVLSDAGVISQMPFRLTFMTTGREGVFETPYGTVEFTHTKRKPCEVECDLIYDERRKFNVANVNRALKDLKRVGRNTDLIIEGNINAITEN